MKRQLTPEQTAKRDARRAHFKALWKQVADTPEAERLKAFGSLGFVNVEGHAFSLANTMLLALQRPNGTVFGGFRQWLKQGRAVRKGEHGAMIWVPIGTKPSDASAQDTAPQAEAAEFAEWHFIIGTVFDISQTDEAQTTATA